MFYLEHMDKLELITLSIMRSSLFKVFSLCMTIAAANPAMVQAADEPKTDTTSPAQMRLKTGVDVEVNQPSRDWRREGFYTYTLAHAVQGEIIDNKRDLGPWSFGQFSQKLTLVVSKDGKVLDAKILSSSFSADQDKLLLEHIRKMQFRPFPPWYKGKPSVTFPLDVRQAQRLAEPTNGPKYPLIEIGVYLIDKGWTFSPIKPATPIPKQYQGILTQLPPEGPGTGKCTPEQLKERATADCILRGVTGRATIKALLDQNGFMKSFELIKATKCSQDTIDLFNLTYKYIEVPDWLKNNSSERILEIDIPTQ